MKYVKIILYGLEILIIVFSATEIFSYLKSPDDYMLGTEAMIGLGGFKYRSNSLFLAYYSVQIIFACNVIVLLAKYRTGRLQVLPFILLGLQLLGFLFA
jgi:hypothetical protein